MQTSAVKPSSSGPPPPGGGAGSGHRAGHDPAALFAGAATAVAVTGALLALTGSGSPLRGPFTLFLLLAAPASAIGAALGGIGAFGRAVVSLAGALAVNLLVAQVMLATHMWSVRGGVVAVTALSSSALLLTALLRRGATDTEGEG